MENNTEVAPQPPITFNDLSLSEPVLRAVADQGFVKPTDIQAQGIPVIMQGRDVIGSSQTGTGKTAAFGLPIISKLQEHGKLRCLILEPVRELAAQVADHFELLGKYNNLRSVLLHGGVGYKSQLDALNEGVDIVIATPGRLLDHLGRGTLKLGDLEILVLDEVDRMLDMGFLPDVRRIVKYCPSKRQTLFFSATMPAAIHSLAQWALHDPFEITIGRRQSPAETVSHAFYPVAYEQRKDLLVALLQATNFESVMIFTRTKAEADQLTVLLKRGDNDHRITTMHSDIRQSDRAKALAGFRDGSFDVIIATDLAARGLDISGVTHVINFRVPENPEDYVHRIGRTGRARKEGSALTLLSGDELTYAEQIERFIGQKIERRKIPDFPYIYTAMVDDDAPSSATLQKMLGRSSRPKPRRRRR